MAELKRRAREMRNNPTEPEKHLWREISGSRFEGFKFRRQEVIGRCIVDFWCPAAGLAVEGVGAVDDSSAPADSPHPNPSPEGEGLKGAISLEGSVG